MSEPVILNPSIVGQAEKAHNALLFRVLDGTGVDEVQWIALQLVLRSGGAADRADLVAQVSAAAKFAPATVEAALAALLAAGRLETTDPGRVTITDSGSEFVTFVRDETGPIVDRVYSAVSADDLATAGRVLAELTARFDAELAAL
jgi:hypothetical protein